MREIRISRETLQEMLDSPLDSIISVKVGWPELQLTPEQVYENAWARACGYDTPHTDHSYFAVRVGTW